MVIANAELAERMLRPADALLRSGRSPLHEVLMRGAAVDLAGGGVVAEPFATCRRRRAPCRLCG